MSEIGPRSVANEYLEEELDRAGDSGRRKQSCRAIPRRRLVLVYAIIHLRRSPDLAETFRIEERELEAGARNWRR